MVDESLYRWTDYEPSPSTWSLNTTPSDGLSISLALLHYEPSPSTSSLNTTPSACSSTLYTDVEHLQTFTLVWLDQPFANNEEHATLQIYFLQHVAYPVLFYNLQSCLQWLEGRPIGEKILLIVPGEFAKKIVPNVHHLTPIIRIYILCSKAENHLKWTQNYFKIRDVVFKAEGLIQIVSRDQIYFDNIEASKAIKIFNAPAHTRIIDFENTSFIWYTLFLEILFSPVYLSSSASSTGLIQILRQSCSNGTESLNSITQIKNTYNKKKAISWLIKNTPLARFLNKALLNKTFRCYFVLDFFLLMFMIN